MNYLKQNRKKKAYSLIEIVFSLAIMAFATTVMFNFIIVGLKVNLASLGRSFVREELSNIGQFMARDLRSADYINSCTGTTCSYIIDGLQINWYINNNVLVKERDGSTEYKSSPSIKVDYLDFSSGYTNGNGNSNSLNVVITISASHNQNLVRQTSVSLRNYQL